MDSTAVDDGDFGDFQTCSDSSSSVSLSNSAAITSNVPSISLSNSSNSLLITSGSSSTSDLQMFANNLNDNSPTPLPQLNIFEADQFKFEQFINKFEQHLEQIFMSNHHLGLDDSPLPPPPPISSSIDPDSDSGVIQDSANNNNNKFLSYNESIPAIRSQEDIINDCPIWWNLTGSFNSKPPLTFSKSQTFKCYIDALAESCHKIQNCQQQQQLANQFPDNNNDQTANKDECEEYCDDICKIKQLLNEKKKRKNANGRLTTNSSSAIFKEQSYPANFAHNAAFQRNNETAFEATAASIAADEEEIANDLDMHSLIIGSVEQSQTSQQDIVASADRAIEEISNIMACDHKSSGRIHDDDDQDDEDTAKSSRNALLSLNAASLLDAALQNWQQSQSQYSHVSAYDQEDDVDRLAGTEDEYDEEQCHSLPAHLNNPNRQTHRRSHHKNKSQDYDSLTNKDDDDDELEDEDDQLSNSLLSLKASNIVLSSKLQSNTNHQTKNNDSSTSKTKNESTQSINQTDPNSLAQKLQQLSIVQLNELYIELEQIIQLRSEVLIQELALRDELEFEKELKNTFVSLLLSVQNKRRHYTSGLSSSHRSRRSFIGRNKPSATTAIANNTFVRRNSNDSIMRATGSGNNNKTKNTGISNRLTFLGASIKESLFSSQTPTPVYLTTVIPYRKSINPVDVPTLQMLIKLLTALNEDSSTVPALLTDYILKVICP